MAGQLEGKVAVVTGAARGQGRSHAVRLAEEGADIIAMDICRQIDTVAYPLATADDLAETAALVERLDRRIVATQTDVRDGTAVRAALERGVAELGRLDIVVANAGICTTYPAHEVPEDGWQDVIDTNLTGVWNICRAAMPILIEAGRGGAMVLTSSSTAHIGIPMLSHYSASKAGVVGLMQALAVELAPHMIRVNTVHPTGVNTVMLQNDANYELFVPGVLDRMAGGMPDDLTDAFKSLNAMPIPWIEPVDVSNAIVFLVSDNGRYVTGTQLRVDAGSAAK